MPVNQTGFCLKQPHNAHAREKKKGREEKITTNRVNFCFSLLELFASVAVAVVAIHALLFRSSQLIAIAVFWCRGKGLMLVRLCVCVRFPFMFFFALFSFLSASTPLKTLPCTHNGVRVESMHERCFVCVCGRGMASVCDNFSLRFYIYIFIDVTRLPVER